MRKNLILFTGIILFSLAPAMAAAEAPIDEDKLREIIKEVIKENPKLMLDTINDYIKEQKKKKQVEQLESSFKNRIKLEVSENNPSKGPEDAAITLIEYTDFQCPYCDRGAKTVKDVMKKYPGKIRLVFKNNPLNFHKQALPAAKAALAANKQGKFWKYHDLLFKNSSKLNEDMFVKFAENLKLDIETFNKDRASGEIADQIDAEIAEAEKHKMKGTPSFAANGVVIRGAQSLDYFSKVIDRLLEEKK